MSPANTVKLEAREIFSVSLPSDLRVAVQQAHRDWDAAGNTARLWARDASLWTNGDEGKWLGWLDIVDQQLRDLSKFKALAAEIEEDGFTHFLLLGTDGASVAAGIFRQTFGPQKGSPELLVLQSTEPAQLRSVRSKIDPSRTLFCVSSTSETTLESGAYVQYFFEETKEAVGDEAGHHFIAVAAPGSRLEALAGELGFRYVYPGSAGLRGCYSAFSDFAMVPHAAAGLDTETLLERAKLMADASKSSHSNKNPGVSLGLVLGTAAVKFGRDKITLISSPSIHALGAWLEQLMAESTGKEGRGLIPIDREPITDPENYGDDRVFAYVTYSNDTDREIEKHVAALESARQPVIRIVLENLDDIAQAMFQWQVATVVAASILRINPYHQPDAEATDAAVGEAISAFETHGALHAETPVFEQDGIKLFADPA
ncbi:MAG: transaldolase phosphoglucose isomerase, partial [Bryobacterales bacterium]|nr:transaldolase phosphoglucose isomerase [Bryobacterales bacterium]